VGSRRNDYSGQTLSAVIGTGRGRHSGTRHAANGMAVFGRQNASQCWPLTPVIGTDTQLLCMGLIFTFWTGPRRKFHGDSNADHNDRHRVRCKWLGPWRRRWLRRKRSSSIRKVANCYHSQRSSSGRFRYAALASGLDIVRKNALASTK
jgi:hypothetical protein